MTDPTEISAEPGLPRRYGGTPPRRRTPVVLGTLFALALLAWAVWAMSATDGNGLDASVSSYRVVSSHEVQVRISAHFGDDRSDGSCLVRATASDHTVVGELNLTTDELRRAQGSWIQVRTERRATTAEVVRCTD